MIKARIKFSPEFLTEAMVRYRQQHRTRWLLTLIKIISFLLLVALGVFITSEGEWIIGLFFAMISALLLFSQRIGLWWMRRSFLKSPFYNEDLTIEISHEAYHVKGSKQDSKLSWSLFSKIVCMPDGFLLFQGPSFFNWIPYSALEDPNQREELKALLRDKTPNYDSRLEAGS
ncbi:MAG: hypothetical protein QOD03_1549 [Verrucomicrobiota bacterium]|jgi:hypothetical protein